MGCSSTRAHRRVRSAPPPARTASRCSSSAGGSHHRVERCERRPLGQARRVGSRALSSRRDAFPLVDAGHIRDRPAPARRPASPRVEARICRYRLRWVGLDGWDCGGALAHGARHRPARPVDGRLQLAPARALCPLDVLALQRRRAAAPDRRSLPGGACGARAVARAGPRGSSCAAAEHCSLFRAPETARCMP